MKRKKQSQPASRRVLDSYKKVGTTFVPPMLHRLGPLSYVSWSRQTMPELIWWDVLIDRTSLQFATKVAEKIARHFRSKDKGECWWAFISDYDRLGVEGIDSLKEDLDQANVLNEMLESLRDFLNLYTQCPISRLLDVPPVGNVDVAYLKRFENRMEELEDKRSRSGILIQAQAVYMGFMSGKFRVQEGLSLAYFPEVANYPKTERSKQVGAAICSTINGVAGNMLPGYAEDPWVQYFWQRSLELHPLDFGHLETR